MTSNALQIAAQLIAQCEGFRGAPYQDSGGTWTIGYGTTRMPDGSHVTAAMPSIDMATARAWLMRDLAETAAVVDGMISETAPDRQRAALYSFAYNEGTSALRGSTLLRMLHQGDVQDAADQFRAWVYAGGKVLRGLQTRRELERAVFLGTVRMDVAPVPTGDHISVDTDALNAAELERAR